MRESRFKKLVNLYLDDEIDEDDLREFEEELRTSSSRRQTLNEYNLLHKATSRALSVRLAKNRMSRRRDTFTIYRYIVPGALAATCLVVALSLFTPYFLENSGMLNTAAQNPPSEGIGSAPVAAVDFEPQSAAIRDFSLATIDFSDFKLEPIFHERFYLAPQILSDSFWSLAVSEPLLPFEETEQILPFVTDVGARSRPLFLKTGVDQPYRREPIEFTFQNRLRSPSNLGRP